MRFKKGKKKKKQEKSRIGIQGTFVCTAGSVCVLDPPHGAAERRMERLLAEEQHRHLQLQEQLAQQLAQSLGNTLSNRLDKVLRDEMKKTVPQSQYWCSC